MLFVNECHPGVIELHEVVGMRVLGTAVWGAARGFALVLGLCAPEIVVRKYCVTRRARSVPVLEPDLGLAFLHSQHLGDLLAFGGGGAAVLGKETFELGELLWGDARALPLDGAEVILGSG